MVIRLPSGRGRPRKAMPSSTDLGTPELIMKRTLGLTAEPLDRCLERRIIDEDQHWCGMHLRWLYTLRYGVPGVSSLALDDAQRGLATEDDPLWRAAREEEFHEAANLLKEKRRYHPLVQLCIHNEVPLFLSTPFAQQAFDRPDRADAMERDIMIIRDGLDILVQHWGRVATAHAKKPSS